MDNIKLGRLFAAICAFLQLFSALGFEPRADVAIGSFNVGELSDSKDLRKIAEIIEGEEFDVVCCSCNHRGMSVFVIDINVTGSAKPIFIGGNCGNKFLQKRGTSPYRN